MFLEQDYPNKELVIVYNTLADIPTALYPENVRFVATRARIIGAKRNEACQHSLGAIVAHWDDDEIYNTSRLTSQAMPIITGVADITGLQHFVFYEAPAMACWIPDESLFSEIFVGNVHGGSLVYNRQVWEHTSRYPNYQLGEDAEFLRRAMKGGARLQPVHGLNDFVYVRHTSNTWKFEKDNFLRYAGWQRAVLPAWAAAHEPFYRQMAGEVFGR